MIELLKVPGGTILLSILLTGCGLFGDMPAGEVELCFQTPGPEPYDVGPTQRDGVAYLHESLVAQVVYDVPTAEAEDVQLSCEPSRVLQVEANGEAWTIGYKVVDQDGVDITPDPQLGRGDSVRLALERISPWVISHAFALSQDDRLLLAINDGLGARLPPSKLEGLSVEEGQSYGSEQDDPAGCGTVAAQRLVFSAESSAKLDSASRGKVELSSGQVEVMNVVAFDYAEIDCDDITDQDAWMAWRP